MLMDKIWASVDKAITDIRISRLEQASREHVESQIQHDLKLQQIEHARELLFQCQQTIKKAESQEPAESYRTALVAELELTREAIGSHSFVSIADKERFANAKNSITVIKKQSATILGLESILKNYVDTLQFKVGLLTQEKEMWVRAIRLSRLRCLMNFVFGITLMMAIFLSVALLGAHLDNFSPGFLKFLLTITTVFFWVGVFASVVAEKKRIHRLSGMVGRYLGHSEIKNVIGCYRSCKRQAEAVQRWMSQLNIAISDARSSLKRWQILNKENPTR